MNKTMNNLIIHPKDSSTDFLKPIYQNVTGERIGQEETTPDAILNLIKKSDRVMMMGHGCSRGLFSIRIFPPYKKFIVVHDEETDIFQNQNENIYIWCNADQYVLANDLHGFYSGMFISEVGEARFCRLSEITQNIVDESNHAFSAILGKYEIGRAHV